MRLGYIGPLLPFLLLAFAPASARGGDAAIPGKLIKERPTLKCLGVRWLVGGDENHNARVAVAYRRAGDESWKRGLDLFRVEPEAMRPTARPPAGETLYASSIFNLDEGTDYEVRLSLVDPDGGSAERVLKMKTRREPQLPKRMRKVEVRPGQLVDALKKARPGDLLLLHAGVYPGPVEIPSGTPEMPIALVGAGDGPAVLDGRGGRRVIACPGLHDVFLEDLTVRGATWGIAFNGGARVTIRRCVIEDIDYGITATNHAEKQQDFFIADNVIRGHSTWPRTRGIEDRRGIQVSGEGHAVCYNRISGFADAIDTFSTYPCAAIDFYRNEISECTDDGIEMDYSEHNTRCFENRLTNVFQGISVQPVHGGPVYVFRNAIYNVVRETFKMHNSPSGALFYHNTSVKAGDPLELMTSEPVSHCVTRNNLFIGGDGRYAFECSPPMRDCDFDYDGFGGQWKLFLKWNGRRYATLEEATHKAPVYRHAVRVEPQGLFQSRMLPPADSTKQFQPEINDLRLKRGSAAIDAGVPLANINDGWQGKAPDLGAYELGQEPLGYGPRKR